MAQEDIEASEELQEFRDLTLEIEQHEKRISGLQKEGVLKDVIADEISATVMPLFSDLAKAQLKHQAMMEDWVTELEEDVEAGPQTGVDLTKEEIETLEFNNARYRELILGTMNAPEVPAELKQAMLELEVKLSAGDKIVRKLREYVEAEEEDSEETEDSGEEEGDDSGDSEGTPAN